MLSTSEVPSIITTEVTVMAVLIWLGSLAKGGGGGHWFRGPDGRFWGVNAKGFISATPCHPHLLCMQ